MEKISGDSNMNEDIEQIYGDYSIYDCEKDYHKLVLEFNKEISKSQTLSSILERIKTESTNIFKISKSFNKNKENDFDTSNEILKYSLESSVARLNEDLKTIEILNNEKDKNIKEILNQFSTGFLKFTELSYQKGVDILLIDNSKSKYFNNVKRLTKYEAIEYLQKMDNSFKEKNTNEVVYYHSTNSKYIEIPCENKHLTNPLETLNLDPFTS